MLPLRVFTMSTKKKNKPIAEDEFDDLEDNDDTPQNIEHTDVIDGSEDVNIPISTLHLDALLLEPNWGRKVTDEVDKKLTVHKVVFNPETGEEELTTEAMWAVHAYFTRDLRLANLDEHQEIYCDFWLEIAGDFIRDNFKMSFLTAISKVAVVCELSQSRLGFLRKRIGKSTIETINKTIEPSKKDVLSLAKSTR